MSESENLTRLTDYDGLTREDTEPEVWPLGGCPCSDPVPDDYKLICLGCGRWLRPEERA